MKFASNFDYRGHGNDYGSKEYRQELIDVTFLVTIIKLKIANSSTSDIHSTEKMFQPFNIFFYFMLVVQNFLNM